MKALYFALQSFDKKISTRLTAWRQGLQNLGRYPEIDWEDSDVWEDAIRAAWRGHPFILAGTSDRLKRYFDELDDDTALLLKNCAYFWILTDDPNYQHKRLPDERTVVLDWTVDTQNVARDLLERLDMFPRLRGLSTQMDWIRQEIPRIAKGKTGPGHSVLILGASGSGKEEVAQSLFEARQRLGKAPLKPDRLHPLSGAWLNLEPGMALTELVGLEKGGHEFAYVGLLELYKDGAIFVDDFESAPKNVQETLLRLMTAKRGQPGKYQQTRSTMLHAEKETNVWLVFATNADIERLVKDKQVREDFLYRFEDRVIVIPSLKERPADFPAIARGVWESLWDQEEGERMGQVPFGSDPLRYLFSKHLEWEGNVRALRALLALAASMKRNPRHNHTPLGGITGIFELITARGKSYRNWVTVVSTKFYSTAQTLDEQIRSADRAHSRCLGGRGHNTDPDESNLTPSEEAARAALTGEGWAVFCEIVRRSKAAAANTVRHSVRLARIIWYVSQNPVISSKDVSGLIGVTSNPARDELTLLAGHSPPLIRKVSGQEYLYEKNPELFR